MGLYGGYREHIGIMENKMETALVYWFNTAACMIAKNAVPEFLV